MATSLREQILPSNLFNSALKIDLCVTSCLCRGVGKYIYEIVFTFLNTVYIKSTKYTKIKSNMF